MDNQKMLYKGEMISESQITFLVEDRKQLLENFRAEARINLKNERKIKLYEKIIGFLVAIVFIMSLVAVVLL